MAIEAVAGYIIKFGSIVGAVVGFFRGLSAYRQNSKIKAGEILIKLEDNFKEHIDILLKIESDKSYREEIVPAIEEGDDKTPEQKQIIKQVDLMFRHFHTCLHIGKLQIDDGLLNSVYRYYHELLIKPNRSEIRQYMEKNWVKVSCWVQGKQLSQIT